MPFVICRPPGVLKPLLIWSGGCMPAIMAALPMLCGSIRLPGA